MALINLAINDKSLRYQLTKTTAGAEVMVTDQQNHVSTMAVDAVVVDAAAGTVSFQVDGVVYRAHVIRQESAQGVQWQVVFAHAPATVMVRTNTVSDVASRVAVAPAATVGQTMRFVPAQQAAAPVCSGAVLKSPLAGRVSRVVVEPGQRVERGQAILFIESMKMENEMGAPRAAFIKTIFIAPGIVVQPEQILVEFEEEGGACNAATKDVDEPMPVQNR